jgi:predicted porin
MAALLESQASFAEPEESAFTPILDLLGALQVYGSFRLRYSTERGEDGFDQKTSRVGVRGRVSLGKRVDWFGRAEFGLSFSDLVDPAGDPGSGVDQNDTVPLRLAFSGFDTPAGRFSFGRQWSSYYDVGVFTDQLPYLCCEAHGVYNAGSVGEISGTGRAEQSFQYRNSFRESVKFSLQGQFRNATENNRSFADTWGAALVYQWDRRLSLGAAFNRVLDGVAEPASGQAKEGDEILILGARYRDGRFYAATTYTDFENHEVDDLSRFYDGSGLAFVSYYQLAPDRIVVAVEYDEINPESAHPGSYRVRFATIGGAYYFEKYWSLFALLRLDDGKLSNGTRQDDATLMLTVHYDFSWTPFKRRHSPR